MFHERARAAAEVVLCSGYPTQVAIAFALQQAGYAPLDAAGRLSGPFLFALSILDATVLVALVLLCLTLGGESPRTVLVGRRPAVGEAVRGAVFLPATLAIVVALAYAVQHYFPALRTVPTNPLEALVRTPVDLVMFVFVAVVAGGVREELQRAFVLHRFEQHLGGPVVGVVVSSVLFGLGHLLQGADAALITGVLGALWGVAYLRRRSVFGPMANHALFNTFELVVAYYKP